ncbi:hypothetical protein AALP_AA4G181000 [Arabis alpina]|uniref:Uncharacterized protein n=1 Tax=Arabis alpina TaxID=50452 RepID=A0A087H408_ARAAL|nr:hypothetical protein AALP_AA4G181000 [Arabis alpina]
MAMLVLDELENAIGRTEKGIGYLLLRSIVFLAFQSHFLAFQSSC